MANDMQITSRLADDQFREHARWVGVALGNFTVLESELEGVFGVVLGLAYEPSMIAFYAIQNTQTKRDIISAAIGRFYSGTQPESDWVNLDPKVTKAINMRNNLAHALWAEAPNRKTVLQMRHVSARGVYARPRALYPLTNLRHHATYIAGVSGRLNRLQIMLRATPRASPQISPSPSGDPKSPSTPQEGGGGGTT